MRRKLASFAVSLPIIPRSQYFTACFQIHRHHRSFRLPISIFTRTSKVSSTGRITPPTLTTMTVRTRNRRAAQAPPPDEASQATSQPPVETANAPKTAGSTKAKRKPRKKAQPTADVPTNPEEVEAMLKKADLIKQKLEEVYPEAPAGFLDHTSPFTLLIAVLLSAQSLDTVVNEVTPELFKQGGTPAAMAALGESKIHSLIKRVGLAPTKAKNIAKLSTRLVEDFDGEVPSSFEELEGLPGVGHKTASVVMMQAFGKAAFPVDTHIWRLACRWGCGDPKSVEKTEENLKAWFPQEEWWADLHVRIILFGREYCPARKHDMDECPVCAFAATEESLEMNRKHRDKFVGATTHKDPYSIREVVKEDKEADEDFVLKKSRKVAKKDLSAKGGEDADGDFAPKKTRKAAKKDASSKDESSLPARRSQRKRKRVTAGEGEGEGDEKVDGDVEVEDDNAEGDTKSNTKRGRPRAKKRAESKEAREQGESTKSQPVRRSNRTKK